MHAHRTAWNWSLAFKPAAVALGLAVALAPPAAGRLAAGTPEDEALYRNLYHTLLARSALMKDRKLAALNLGVKVEDRVAYLWGGVPSPDLIPRAVDIVRRLPDIRDVRSQLFVEEPADARPTFLPPPQTASLPAAPLPAASLPPAGGADPAAANPFLTMPAPAAPGTGQPGSVWTVPRPKETVQVKPTVNTQSARPNESLFVLPAIAVPSSGLAAPGVSHRFAPDPLDRQIEVLRAGNARLQLLRIRVDGGRVYLSGGIYDWQDLHDLSREIARLPGVTNVIIDQVQVVPAVARR